MDFEALSSQLLRRLRGKRSQRAHSSRLGFRTNVAYTWEAGKRWPTAAAMFRVAASVKLDVRAALRGFYHHAPPEWLGGADEGNEGRLVAALLADLRGRIPLTTLAKRSGFSRHAVSRWLSGRAEPRLPEFLAMIEACTLRALDFVAQFVDPASLPAAADAWQALIARRAIAFEMPWSHAVLRCLELDAYRAAKSHRPGWIAGRLGISIKEEAACLEALENAGVITWSGARFDVDEAMVDTGVHAEPERRRLKSFWTEVARQRIDEGAAGMFSYNLFCVSRADLERLREMHVRYFMELRSVVASSARSECVALANIQLFELEGTAG